MKSPTHLFIHIGWPKTGTSSLQKLCSEHQGLLNDHGISYYQSRKNAQSIGSVCRAIQTGGPLEEECLRFTSWLDHCSTDSVLISSERLSSSKLSGITQFVDPSRWSSITVIAYLRAQEEYFEGWYKQVIKWGGKQSVDQYLTRSAPWKSADYERSLGGWADWCSSVPDGVLDVRLFDRCELVGQNIGADFFSALGLSDPLLTSCDLNVSPSAALIELYLRLPEINRLQQINRKMVASDLFDATGRDDIFPDTVVNQIRARYAVSNEAVRQRFFPDRTVLFQTPQTRSLPKAPSDALRRFLIDTISEMRGAEVAATARRALTQ